MCLVTTLSLTFSSLIVLDFAISLYGSSCNQLFFLTPFRFFSFSSSILAFQKQDEIQRNRKRKQTCENQAKKRDLHELLRLASELPDLSQYPCPPVYQAERNEPGIIYQLAFGIFLIDFFRKGKRGKYTCK